MPVHTPQNDAIPSVSFDEAAARLKSACELASKNGIDTSGYLHHIQTYS